ncbi:hypothetical protein ES288_1Z031200v1 [Gossypium darwinii]|uniref:Protein ENHANCED DISEASE RESISTANCE 2 C-terminal domain-containing protein n=1 Tax=Gossypium darwinii TaxID=34276 RepID=A0A5C7J1D7_GOSDA|nr:hypothetical protein ES288_1Z031200v1 [Gossypium darwinii]
MFGWVYWLCQYTPNRWAPFNPTSILCLEKPVKPKPAPAAISSTALKQASDAAENASKELDLSVPPIHVDPSQFNSVLHKGKDDADTNCWTSPGGAGFMIRGQTYLKNSANIMGGNPLLKLIAVDWFKVDKATDKIALHPKSLAQSDAGKNLPFILVINLEVRILVLYYAAERPVRKDSLLEKFADGTDQFLKSSVVSKCSKGYWMVKRAVGTKACLLGKAVTCKYFRQDNFLESVMITSMLSLHILMFRLPNAHKLMGFSTGLTKIASYPLEANSPISRGCVNHL